MKPHTELFHSFPTMKLYESWREEKKKAGLAKRKEQMVDSNNSNDV